jgi:hypothetical protein
MSPPLITLLLMAALACWWAAQPRPTRITICPHCGDLVEAVPSLPVRCPSCTRWLWTV